jgi:hypothetical protein
MADPDRVAATGRHITSIANRTASQTDALLSAVRAHCWPSGTFDQTNAPALEWVRRWRPAQGMVPALVCGCAAGICAVCN